ncbi:MAG TPA: SRPBCC family protein [Methylocella sp.]|jgi:hypothetical protein
MSDPVFSIQSEFFPTSVDVVFDAFNDVEGWPRWAVHHIKSEVRNPDGTYGIQTPRRTGVLRLKTERRHGIIDYEFNDPKAGTRLVSGRVAPFADGAVLSINYGQPPGLSHEHFAHGMTLVKEELGRLRRLLEVTPGGSG